MENAQAITAANLSRVSSMEPFHVVGVDSSSASSLSHAAPSTSDGEISRSVSHNSEEHDTNAGWVQVDHTEVEVQHYEDAVHSQL